MSDFDHEFAFELGVCRWAEQSWPPDGEQGPPVLVARQLGVRDRRWDTVIVECDPDGLAARAAFGEAALDSDLLHVVRHAPPEWAWYRDALPDPDYPWRYVREAVHQAAERDLVETRTQGGRIQLRRHQRYPDWVSRLVTVENKPDLDASAARTLAPQLERDVALGLAHETWVATASTNQRVEPALLERLPVEAGILTFDGATANVLWHPRTLAAESAGTRIVDRGDTSRHASAAARFEYVDSETKADKRLEIAERAYERGWRSYVDTMRPDCRHFRLRAAAEPQCGALERCPRPAECAGSCPAFEPEPPAWRQRGWPLDGGPGRTLTRVLARQRARRRPEN